MPSPSTIADLSDGSLPHNGTDTSRQAAAAAAVTCDADWARILDLIANRGTGGATCDEIEVALCLSHQTTSARLRGLAQRGHVVYVGRKRATRTGCQARVYILAAREK